MSRTSHLEELQRLTKALTKKRIWLRHQAVVLAQQGHSAPAIAGPWMLPPRRSGRVGRYNQGGRRLQGGPTPDARPAWPRRMRRGSRPRRAGPTPEDGVCTSAARTSRIQEEEFGVSLRRQAIYDLLHRLDYSSLMPRPQHEQANPEVQEFFKEIVVEQIDAIAARIPRRRFIPISRMKPASARRGRSHGSGAAGFATACGAADGIQLALRAGGRLRRHGGDVGGDHAHAEHRGRQPVLGAVLGELPAGVHAVLIWDGAGFHTGADVVVPSNVSLIQLPPYSPELNPVENLWHYLRAHHWSNRRYRDYDALQEEAVRSRVRSAKTQKRSRPSAILDISQGAHEIAGKRIKCLLPPCWRWLSRQTAFHGGSRYGLSDS